MTYAYIILFILKCILCVGYEERDFPSIKTIPVEAMSLADLDSLQDIYNKLSNAHQSTGAFKVSRLNIMSKIIFIFILLENSFVVVCRS